MSSESKLGIIEPHEYQCRNIDLMIEKSIEATAFCKSAMVAIDNQTIVQANKEVHERIQNFEEQLEEFRTAIENVRVWGDEWKEKAKSLLNKYEPHVFNPPIDFDDDIPF